MSHNRSLEGVLDELNNARLTEAGSLDVLPPSDSEDEDIGKRNSLPGAKRGDEGKRQVHVDALLFLITALLVAGPL